MPDEKTVFRFSLRDLFLLITLAALALSFSLFTQRFEVTRRGGFEHLQFTIHVLLFAAAIKIGQHQKNTLGTSTCIGFGLGGASLLLFPGIFYYDRLKEISDLIWWVILLSTMCFFFAFGVLQITKSNWKLGVFYGVLGLASFFAI